MRRLMNMKQSMTLKRSRNLKRLAVTMLALLLAMGTGAAMADKGRHGGGHGGPDKHHGGHDRHHGYNKHHGGYGQAYRHGYKDGYRNGHWRAGRWYPAPYPRAVYYYPRPDYDRATYYPLGAALIGSAITYSLFHSHDGVRCHETHGASYSSPAPQVVGCHRVERYPDGSERRVDVPLSECY